MGCRVAFGRVGEIALHVDESEQESFKKRDELGRSRNLQRQSNVKEKNDRAHYPTHAQTC